MQASGFIDSRDTKYVDTYVRRYTIIYIEIYAIKYSISLETIKLNFLAITIIKAASNLCTLDFRYIPRNIWDMSA